MNNERRPAVETWPATQVMTVREASEYLRIHPTTIYRLLKRGLIPAFRIGSDWRFRLEELDKWRLQWAQRP